MIFLFSFIEHSLSARLRSFQTSQRQSEFELSLSDATNIKLISQKRDCFDCVLDEFGAKALALNGCGEANQGSVAQLIDNYFAQISPTALSIGVIHTNKCVRLKTLHKFALLPALAKPYKTFSFFFSHENVYYFLLFDKSELRMFRFSLEAINPKIVGVAAKSLPFDGAEIKKAIKLGNAIVLHLKSNKLQLIAFDLAKSEIFLLKMLEHSTFFPALDALVFPHFRIIDVFPLPNDESDRFEASNVCALQRSERTKENLKKRNENQKLRFRRKPKNEKTINSAKIEFKKRKNNYIIFWNYLETFYSIKKPKRNYDKPESQFEICAKKDKSAEYKLCFQLFDICFVALVVEPMKSRDRSEARLCLYSILARESIAPTDIKLSSAIADLGAFPFSDVTFRLRRARGQYTLVGGRKAVVVSKSNPFFLHSAEMGKVKVLAFRTRKELITVLAFPARNGRFRFERSVAPISAPLNSQFFFFKYMGDLYALLKSRKAFSGFQFQFGRATLRCTLRSIPALLFGCEERAKLRLTPLLTYNTFPVSRPKQLSLRIKFVPSQKLRGCVAALTLITVCWLFFGRFAFFSTIIKRFY